MTTDIELSASEARRLALASLGFGAKKPARAGMAHVRATAARLSAIQIDSVNVLARAHYLPTFSRYGPYPMSALDTIAHGRRELFEYWGHAACFLPIDLYPLMRWRMENQRAAWAGLSAKQKRFIEAVYSEVSEQGRCPPVSCRSVARARGRGGAGRRASMRSRCCFARDAWRWRAAATSSALYDIPERVIPEAVLHAPAIAPEDAKKALIVRAARAMGVGTARGIAQYFHIDAWWDRLSVNGRRPPAKTSVLFDELVEDGRLERVRVEGWKPRIHRAADARIPRSDRRRARSSRRSIPCCGSGNGRKPCSTSTTRSRSTFPVRNGFTATTSCRS